MCQRLIHYVITLMVLVTAQVIRASIVCRKPIFGQATESSCC